MNLPSVYVDLNVPRRAGEASQLSAEGICSLGAEFLVYRSGRHPYLLMSDAVPGDLGSILADGMRTAAKVMYPRPVTYRALDLRSSELRHLAGGKDFEDEEENPVLGRRGMVRAQRDPEMFATELAALRQVRAEGYPNLHLMLPFVRWPHEVEWAISFLDSAGLRGAERPQLQMMVETPASVLRAAEFAQLVDGVCIRIDELAQLVLAIDSHNNAFVHQSWDDDPAVVSALEWAVSRYAANTVSVGVCGDALARSNFLLEQVCAWDGVSSISVSVDYLQTVRRSLAGLSLRT